MRTPLPQETRETLEKLVRSMMSENKDIAHRAMIACENALYTYAGKGYDVAAWYNKVTEVKIYYIRRSGYVR